MKIYTADKETGTFIEECKSIQEAKKLIQQYEKEEPPGHVLGVLFFYCFFAWRPL